MDSWQSRIQPAWSKVTSAIRWVWGWNGLPWVIIGIGVLLRLNMYLQNRSLWLDEAAQALNIINRGFMKLMEPLDYNQAAPLGYLWIERLAVKGLGDNEFALRLYPFICGILALVLFYQVALRYVARTSALIGLALFALSGILIYYSQEMRQYSGDMLIALILLWLSLYLYQTEISLRDAVLAGLVGGLLIWFSHPTIFMLAGLGMTLALSYLIRQRWKEMALFSISVLFWLGSFGAYYFLFLFNKNQSLIAGHALGGSFLPVSGDLSQSWNWLFARLIELFGNPLGFSEWGIPAFIFLVGGGHVLYRERAKLSFLLSPILFALAASELRSYPFYGRFLMFMAPAMMLLIGKGASQIAEWTHARGRLAAILLVTIPILQLFTSPNLATPFIQEEIRPVLEYLSQHYVEGDTIFAYYISVYPYRYYAPKLRIANASYIVGVSARNDWKKYEQDLQKLGGRGRVWILFSHVWTANGVDEQRLFLHFLDNLGTRLDSFRAPGAAVFLYDLR